MSQSPSVSTPETHTFQAEVSQVLSLVINSLYSHREIFLRELVSNASDALDRLKYRTLTEHELAEVAGPAEIRLLPDEGAGTLTVEDTGVGMTREELATNLGTVAHSGTQAFLRALAEGADSPGLIGQFGVGFYSAFLVADRVEVVSRAAGAEGPAWRWASEAKETFTLEEAERSEPGTSVILHMREDQRDLLSEWRLRDLVTRYSDYVSHPIKLRVAEHADHDHDHDHEEVDGAASAEPTFSMQQVNKARALWQRPKTEVSDDEYKEFYRHLTHDWEEPLAWSHFTVEGRQLFTGLLFVPRRPPFDLFQPEQRDGIRLHVKRVFIMDDAKELLPRWLRFLRGLVDSDDLPLNVSRELLQDSAVVRAIQKQLVRKTLDLLEEMATERPDDYRAFWEAFGTVLKEGLHLAAGGERERLAKLVRFRTSHDREGWASLAEVVERMKEGQKELYYVLGSAVDALAESPYVEALESRGYEVIYMTDAIDEWAVVGLGEVEGHKLASAMKADLALDEEDLSEEAKEERQARSGALEDLVKRFGAILSDHVSEVRLSSRLTSSPACLVVPEGGLHAHVERILRASDRSIELPKRILEIHPTHPVIEAIRRLHAHDPESIRVREWIQVLHDQALVTEGSPLVHPARFAERLTRLLQTVAEEAARGLDGEEG